MSDAASRAAARKAKILARGNTGLAKLAQSARGDEAQSLYAEDFKPSPSSTPQSETPPIISQSTKTPSTSTFSSSLNPTSNAQRNPQPANMSAEQQAMSSQLESMMSMFGGGPPGGANGELPDMATMLSQMMGRMGPSSGPEGSQRLLGDLDDPAGLGGLPPNLFGGGRGGDGGNGDMPFPFPGMGMGMGMGGTTKKSKSERYFPMIHFISIILLALFTVGWWEPMIQSRHLISAIEGNWIQRWSGLSKSIGKFGGVEVLPAFWAWTTLELILQTTRFMILKSPPPPHSLLQNFLPLLPPKISRPLLTGSRYLQLLSQTYKDGCLFIFSLGFSVIIAQVLDGGRIL
ncbi:uncharacterized protein IL334_002046 [Kwoniella shivajii]|uniref:Golgi to ER traffic protein 2 n=1 Tax=Kwoniella shivajii TaxID=564305 RepID=A0ABZ1CV94_9TREE|nr:hypothetical protein IL334_002046 [Kwoniella shivajii]